MIFGVDNRSSVHGDNREKDILRLGEGPAYGLNDTTIIAENEYHINFSEQQKKFCLSLHYHGSSSYLLANWGKIYQSKEKCSDIKPYELCLCSISKYFTVKNVKSF